MPIFRIETSRILLNLALRYLPTVVGFLSYDSYSFLKMLVKAVILIGGPAKGTKSNIIFLHLFN